MAKFIVRRLLLMLLTMLLVSIAVFAISEAAPGNIARNVLGHQVTPEQEAAFLAQNGLDRPLVQRYISWLLGSDWLASARLGLPVKRIATRERFWEWWAVLEDGSLARWELVGEDLLVVRQLPDGSEQEAVDNERWQIANPTRELKRLEGHRAAVLESRQLTSADRTAIIKQLDTILAILRQAKTAGTGQEALNAALAAPEASLTAMMAAEAGSSTSAFEAAARDASKSAPVLLAGEVYRGLSAPDARDLETSELQAMARQLDRAAEAIEGLEMAQGDQVRRAFDHLMDEEPQEAREALAAVVPEIEAFTVSLGTWLGAIERGDYRRAVSILQAWSDPSETPLDETQVTVLSAALAGMHRGLQRARPDLAEALDAATERMDTGELEAARESLAAAATILSEVGHTIARTDAASRARVARSFWGVDKQNHAVRWEKGSGEQAWVFLATQWVAVSGGPQEYIPLQKGLLRGDPGVSLRTGRPVSALLFTRLRNSLVLAGIAFAIVMPIALILGLIAGLNEGKPLDRLLSIGGMIFSVSPEFATGIFLILIFAFWLDWVPGATVFGEDAPWTRPDMLVLPVLTLTLLELGYVLRITRASMADVMKAPYIRTAFLKGLPRGQIVTHHAIRNALMAPITVIMLHVNWLLGGIVIVEVIFGYPGLGSYLLDSARFKDVNAIEAGAMILVAVAVSTQLLADVIYTFLNPRIRYS